MSLDTDNIEALLPEPSGSITEEELRRKITFRIEQMKSFRAPSKGCANEIMHLIHSYTEAAVREARIDEALKARDCIVYDEAAIDKIDERIWQLKGENNA